MKYFWKNGYTVMMGTTAMSMAASWMERGVTVAAAYVEASRESFVFPACYDF